MKNLLIITLSIFLIACEDDAAKTILSDTPVGSDPEIAEPIESAPEISDPLEGLTPYDPNTFVDHRDFSSPIVPVSADYEMCGAIADWAPGDDRVLYIDTQTSGWDFFIENGPYNYYFEIRTNGNSTEAYWDAGNCQSGVQSWTFNSGQCQFTINQWCSNYYTPQNNYIDMDVRWYHEAGNDGDYTDL